MATETEVPCSDNSLPLFASLQLDVQPSSLDGCNRKRSRCWAPAPVSTNSVSRPPDLAELTQTYSRSHVQHNMHGGRL